MKIINKYVLNEVKLPTLFGISLFTFIFLIEIIMTMMENIIVKGISPFNVARILSFYLPPILAQTIPMGLFLGVMITYSNFTRTSELTAMQSMGLPLKKIVQPMFYLSLGLTLFIFFLQESIIPRSFTKLEQLTVRLAYENPTFQLKSKIFMKDMEEYTLYIDEVNGLKKKAENILIFQKQKGTPYPMVLLGKEAQWENATMILKDAEFLNLDGEGKESLRGEFQEKRVPLSAYIGGIEMNLKELETQSIAELWKNLKEKSGKERYPYLTELNRKLAVPLSTLFLGVLGVVLSVGHHRSGKGASFGMSLGIIFLYIVLLNVGVVLGTRGVLHPGIGIWIPDVILALFTIVMYRRKAARF
jgi:lipopolysaccharide export system permease protein